MLTTQKEAKKNALKLYDAAGIILNEHENKIKNLENIIK